jgi:SAM-dependent methyltransferase
MSRRLTECNLCRVQLVDTIEPRWVRDGYEIIQCPLCGLISRRDLPSEQELAVIYNDGYFGLDPEVSRPEDYLDYLADEELHRTSAQRRLRWLRRTLPTGGRVLDVGAAAGFFVDEAGRAGWRARGVDVAAGMTRWGREHLGVDLDAGAFATMDVTGGPFDAITMWDYIEHSLDPRADVDKASCLLSPGGVLALSTGDIASAFARLSGSRWHLLTPKHHNFYFSARTIRGLLYSVGLEVEAVKRMSVPCSVRYCLHKAQTMVQARSLAQAAERVASTRIGDVTLGVNLFDIVTVLARRPA